MVIGVAHSLHYPDAVTGSYLYDANGNMTNDPAKGSVIQYNHLNLPSSISIGGSVLTNTYDASGIKHKQSYSGGSSADTYYLGSMVYQGTDKMILTEEGRVVEGDQGKLEYEYFLKDHLGNVRVSFKADEATANLKQINHYYPFGLEFAGYKYESGGLNQDFKYNGKELIEEGDLGWYDYLIQLFGFV
jgi:hypothetical protein